MARAREEFIDGRLIAQWHHGTRRYHRWDGETGELLEDRAFTASEASRADAEDAEELIGNNETTIDSRLDAARAALDSVVQDARSFATTSPPAFNAGANASQRIAALEAAVAALQTEARRAARRDVRFARALQALARKVLRSFDAIEADDGAT